MAHSDPTNLPSRTERTHVTVPHRRHGNHRPPERIRYTPEVALVGIGFGEVDGAGEEDDADEEEEDEEAKFAHAGPDRLSKDLESLGMARQFEYTEDTDETDDTEDGQRHGLVGSALAADQHRAEGYEVGEDGDEIDQVHERLEEQHRIGTGGEAQDEFSREPHDTNGLDHKERLGEVRKIVFRFVFPVSGWITGIVNPVSGSGVVATAMSQFR